MRSFVAVVVVAAIALPATAERVVVDRVVAIIDDAVILASELELRVAPMRAQLAGLGDVRERERRAAKLDKQVLDTMVDEQLVLAAARAARVTVEEADIDAYLELLKKDHKLNDEQLRAAMAAQGMTRASLRDDIMRQRAISVMVAPKVTISDDDVRSRYAELGRRSALTGSVELARIVIAVPEHASEQQLAAATARAVRIRDSIAAGTPFAEVARTESDDAATREGGGLVGWIDVTATPPELEAVIRSMEVGDVRGPIASPMGLALYRANAVKRAELRPFEAMREELREELRRKAIARQTEAWLGELRKRAYVELR